jgi:hypothetical protein
MTHLNLYVNRKNNMNERQQEKIMQFWKNNPTEKEIQLFIYNYRIVQLENMLLKLRSETLPAMELIVKDLREEIEKQK